MGGYQSLDRFGLLPTVYRLYYLLVSVCLSHCLSLRLSVIDYLSNYLAIIFCLYFPFLSIWFVCWSFSQSVCGKHKFVSLSNVPVHLIWGEDIHATDVSTVVFKLMVFEFTCLRDEIAACAEKAYEHISFPEATRILYFESEKDMAAFAQKVTIILSNICRVVTSALILFKKILIRYCIY